MMTEHWPFEMVNDKVISTLKTQPHLHTAVNQEIDSCHRHFVCPQGALDRWWESVPVAIKEGNSRFIWSR